MKTRAAMLGLVVLATSFATTPSHASSSGTRKAPYDWGCIGLFQPAQACGWDNAVQGTLEDYTTLGPGICCYWVPFVGVAGYHVRSLAGIYVDVPAGAKILVAVKGHGIKWTGLDDTFVLCATIAVYGSCLAIGHGSSPITSTLTLTNNGSEQRLTVGAEMNYYGTEGYATFALDSISYSIT